MKKSKDSSFLKKRSKKLLQIASGNGLKSETLVRLAMSKSFLVLFFKKEHPFFLAFLLLFALSGCGGDPPPPDEAYAPLHYEYLKSLHLKVGVIDVQDHTPPPAPGDVTAQDPVQPGQVLAQMARDRLFAAGTTGHAEFVVDAADIIQGEDGALSGELAGHLHVLSDSGQPVAFAEARVARRHVPGSDPENLRNNLYDMTKQMMDDMNVELEYQIRRSMRDWLVSNTALPAPVAAEPLAPAVPPPAPAPQPDLDNPMEAPPDGVQMSPPPGFLQPPK